MVRKLTLLLISTILFIPGGAFALGLGEIHLKSALNQAFDANIDLLSVKPDELDGVKVKLAAPEAFVRAGVDRRYMLTKLRYKPDLNKAGKPVIHVTSTQAIREPFLNFLIEVNWAKGRLVREYTVLLDPPVTLDRKPSPVEMPAAKSSPPKTQQPSARVPATVQQQRQAPISATEQRQPVGSAVTPNAGMDQYGPVMANESLWKIAKKIKPQGATVEQMMMALQRKNPSAFYRQNINNLKRGAILRMPTQKEIDLFSVREARAEFSSQVVEWKGYRAALSANDAGGKSEATPSQKQPAPTSELKLASARPEGEGKGGASEKNGSEEVISKLENELILAREQFESAKQERSDLSSQISQLESQLTDFESLLTVRNEQLARLQNELRQSEADASQKLDEMPAVKAATDSEPEKTEAASTEEKQELAITADKEEEIVKSEMAEKEALDSASTKSQNDQTKPQPVATPKPEAGSIFDTLKTQFENNKLAVAGGGLAILLLLLLLSRRRNTESGELEESILVGAQDDEDTESLGRTGDDTEGVISEAAETSFLSEFSHSDMDVLQDDTGEVDPVAEADVYIAYGRYQQAEELLRQAIDHNPDHARNHFKLLEILFVTKNAQAFSEIAETLATEHSEQTDTDAWQQVVAMGYQLNPTHALFASGSGDEVVLDEGRQPVDAALDVEPQAVTDEDLDLLDLSDLTADFNSGDGILDEPISTLLEDDSLDFDLNLGLDVEGEDATLRNRADDALLNADVSEISADTESNDLLVDLSAELPDSSVFESEIEKESSELSESLSLDELDLGVPLEEPDNSGELLDESDDLAAALSSFSDEQTDKNVPDSSGLATAPVSPENDLQDESITALELEQALSGFANDLSLDDALETGDLEAELENLSADLVAEEPESAGLADAGELAESLSADDAEEEANVEALLSADTDNTLESDELTISSDLEQEAGKSESDISDQNNIPAVPFDDIEPGELSVSESEDPELLVSGDGLSELSAEDLVIDDELSTDATADEQLPELSEEPDKVDEVNTKLDLARAYVEMGDEEGARSILDEVLNEGDDMQKKDAQELLGCLS